MFNLPILQSGSGWNARWNTGAWPSPWALSLAFLGGAAAVTWFCKTHLIGVFWGITHPKWYEHVDKEVNHIRSCNLSSWIVYWWSLMWIWRCNYIIVYIYMYLHDDDYFRMAGDGLFQKMFANALLYFFVISLIKISFILVVDTHREKKNVHEGDSCCYPRRTALKLLVDTSQKHQLSSSNSPWQVLDGRFWNSLSCKIGGCRSFFLHKNRCLRDITIIGKCLLMLECSPKRGQDPNGSSICVGFLQFHDLQPGLWGGSLEICSP